jgi:predicted acyltransferase
MSVAQPAPSPAPQRIASLDQFRGFTVASMMLVNFLGHFKACPPILAHHKTYCSYADTVMPMFFLAVGYGFRLTYLKRVTSDGPRAAIRHAISRNIGLLLLAVVVDHFDGGVETWEELRHLGVRGFLAVAFQRGPFQTLTSIALTSLWCLPVIGRGVGIRLVFLLASASVHILLSRYFFFEWAMNRPVIDGGQLACLSWATPLLLGSIAYDLVDRLGPRRAIAPILGLGGLFMAIGYGLSCLGGVLDAEGSFRPGLAASPFTAPTFTLKQVVESADPGRIWVMSQRAGTVSYLAFAGGFGLATLAFFVLLSDVAGLRIGFFRTLGRNALAVYITHMLIVFAFIKPYAPADSPIWYALCATALAFAITYLFMRHLEKDGAYLKL